MKYLIILSFLLIACEQRYKLQKIGYGCKKYSEPEQVTRCSNNSGGASLVGGMLFGTTGAVVGGAMGSGSKCTTTMEKHCLNYDYDEIYCWDRETKSKVDRGMCE